MMWYPIHAINLNLLQVKGRSDLFLRLEIIKKILGVIMLCITLPLGLKVMCIGMIVNSLIALIINTYYTGKLIHVGFLVQMKDLLPTLFLSLTMFVIVFLFNRCIENLYLQLSGGILLGMFFYLSLSKLFHFSELNEILSLIKRN